MAKMALTAKKIYPLNFKDTKEIDIGLKYQAIGSGQVDVINAFSTDRNW